MENYRDSRNQQVDRKLNIAIILDDGNSCKFTKDDIVELVSSKSFYHLDIAFKNIPPAHDQFLLQNIIFIDSHHIRCSPSNEYSYIFRLPSNISNLQSLISLLARPKKENSDYSPLSSHAPIERKAYRAMTNKLQNDELLLRYRIFNQLNRIGTDSESLEQLIIALKNNTDLKSYHDFIFLIHEKGQKLAHSTRIVDEDQVSKSQIDASDFNNTYNLIKKRKKRAFNQSHILNPNLDVVGTFLACGFEFNTHSIIFIVTRHDFLDWSKEEETFFLAFSSYLKPIVKGLLKKERVSIRGQEIYTALNLFPAPLAIMNSNGQFFFRNYQFNNDENNNEDDIDNFERSEISSNIFLLTKKPQSMVFTSDVFHQQRISLLGELLNTLRHELSNPLFGLKLACDVIDCEQLSADAADTVNAISLNVDRCQTIIKNFTRLYKDDDNVSATPLNNILEEVITLTKSESREIVKRIIYKKSNLRNLQTSKNVTWITQIIFNLVINATQSIKENGISPNDYIHIEVDQCENTNDILISIEDSGKGVSDEEMSQIFSPFYTTKKYGTGLGLSICQDLARKMNGTISFCKNKNYKRGACFTLALSSRCFTIQQ